jgi:thiamine-monophosphate kinase
MARGGSERRADPVTAEFDLIESVRARAGTRPDVVLGIGDDAAVLRMPAGKLLVVAMDTLNAGVHFPEGTAAADIGWKSLAVNLSDLAAMGAQPAWCTLSLSLPEADQRWLAGFLDGFLAIAGGYGVALVGGDTTRGPLSVCVTVHGFVDEGRALQRDGAKSGDDIWVSGTLGDAAGALAQWREHRPVDHDLRARLDRPTPRVGLGRALAGVAHGCIDVSDGLLADLGHVCTRSRVGAQIALPALPASVALRAHFDDEARHVLQATGGDDYELCFTAAPAARQAIERIAVENSVTVTRVGTIVASGGVRALLVDGREWNRSSTGYAHFAPQ